MRINSPFSIMSANLVVSSISEDNMSVDIKNNIIELRFYQNLFKPYVDAKLVLLDDFGLRNSLSIQGTERLTITIGSSPTQPLLEKTFFVSKIIDTSRTNERSEILSLELVEEHVYVNSVKQISRSFTSTFEEMAENICQNELNKTVVRGLFSGSAQGVRKVLVPYLNPLQAINWIMNRATTRTGSPIFLSGDLYSNSLYLSDLDNLLKEPIINEDLPYRFGASSKVVDDQSAVLGPYYDITAFKETDMENTLQLFETGAVGSLYGNLDAGTGQQTSAHLSVRDILTEMYTNGLIDDATTQSIFDPSLLIDGKLSDEYNSQHVHQVTSANTYNQFLSYHDESRILLDDQGNAIESKLKMKNKIIRHLLKKNTIDVSLDGVSLFTKKTAVGERVRILFLNSNVQSQGENISDQIDNRKSGDYLITAISHKLIDQKHDASMRVTKLGDLPKNFKI